MDMTAADFAKKIGVSRKTVYDWVKNKSLPPGVTYRLHLRRLIIEDNRKKLYENKRDGQG